MYWPTSVVRSLALPAPLDHEPIIKLRQNRRGNFFITLTKSGLGVWDVRVSYTSAYMLYTVKLMFSPRSSKPPWFGHRAAWNDGVPMWTSVGHMMDAASSYWRVQLPLMPVHVG